MTPVLPRLMTDTQHTTLTAVASSVVTTALLLGIYAAANSPGPKNAPATPQVTANATLPAPVTRDPASIPHTVAKTEPAVVSVVITKDVPVVERYYEQRGGGGDPFNDPFFSPFDMMVPRERKLGTQQREVGGGTAFFVSSDGLLMTNKHVVDDPEATYTVFLNDGRKLQAKVVTRDPTNDVALLKVEGKDFPFLNIADREPVLGETVIAIGNALAEFRNTVSVGVVSGLSRSITAGGNGTQEQLSRIIQTDAAINQGNSGGPLLSADGQVLGMNTAVAGGAQNIAFAIPSADLQRALQSYKQYGKIVRPYLGVRYVYVTDDLKKKNNLSVDHGALVSRGETAQDLAVIPNSPADKAGLRENDIILEMDGQAIDEEHQLATMIQSKLPGDTVKLKILRQGKEQEVTVKLEEWKDS